MGSPFGLGSLMGSPFGLGSLMGSPRGLVTPNADASATPEIAAKATMQIKNMGASFVALTSVMHSNKPCMWYFCFSQLRSEKLQETTMEWQCLKFPMVDYFCSIVGVSVP